jgi:hypothetical protein
MDRTENTVPLLLFPIAAVQTCLFVKPLLSNGSCIFAYLVVVAQQRSVTICINWRNSLEEIFPSNVAHKTNVVKILTIPFSSFYFSQGLIRYEHINRWSTDTERR